MPATERRIGSLFSGAGGLDMAVEQVFGGHTVWHCEVDPAASKVLAHRWPHVENLGDITEVNWNALPFHIEDIPGVSLKIDVLCAGWPCQPFSLAGKRKGADDERALWPHVARAVRMVRPRIVVLENVSAVLGPEFQRVANDLAALGYDISWTCLRASDVGAPHRRERLFAVAYADGWRLEVGTQRDGDAAQSELPASQRRDVGGRGNDAVELLPTPQAHDGMGGAKTPEQIAKDSHAPANLNETAQNILGHQAGWGKYEPAIRRWEQVTRPAPAPTEPNKNGNPRLSAAFSEWLMGWPTGHVTAVPGITRNDQLRIIGNGVVPQQAEAAIRWLLSVSEAAA